MAAFPISAIQSIPAGFADIYRKCRFVKRSWTVKEESLWRGESQVERTHGTGPLVRLWQCSQLHCQSRRGTRSGGWHRTCVWSSRWLRSTLPLCRGVYGRMSLWRMPSSGRGALQTASAISRSGCWRNRLVNSKPLSVCTHSTVIAFAAGTLLRLSAESRRRNRCICSSYAPSTRYREYSSMAVYWYSFSSRRRRCSLRGTTLTSIWTRCPGPLHLLIGLRACTSLPSVFLRRSQSFASQHPPQALQAACMSPRLRSRAPQFHDAQASGCAGACRG